MESDYSAFLSQIVTDDIREVLICGIENGLRLYKEIDRKSRSRLGDYAGNTETRALFSCLCHELELACNTSICNVEAHSERRTSSVFVEIATEKMLLHLRNNNTELPQYAKDKLQEMNGMISADKRNYILLSYHAENGRMLTKVSIVLKNADGKTLCSEPLEGTWCQAAAA